MDRLSQSIITMNLNIIPFESVRTANQEASSEWKKTGKYNTHMHSYTEIAAFVPENGFKHVYPDLTVEHFSNWAPLILSSQGITKWHEFHLSALLLEHLISTHTLWIGTRPARQDIRDDPIDFFPPKTLRGTTRDSVFDGRKWFLRLDFCSAKDGSLGTRPVTSLDDVLTALYTSKRAVAELRDIIAGSNSRPARLFLLPYNDGMKAAREFRVFCPPVRERVTAISQYRWFEPFYVRDAHEAGPTAERVWKGATRIHKQILEYAERLSSTNVKKKLRSEGFVFDVFETERGEVQLIEINPFGAMSGCGSCLFHWIEDAKVIYGEREEVEVRIAM